MPITTILAEKQLHLFIFEGQLLENKKAHKQTHRSKYKKVVSIPFVIEVSILKTVKGNLKR